MQNSQSYLSQKGIVPKISFQDGKSHKVTLVKDKIDKIKDANGTEKEGVKYMVFEDGTPKTFFTASSRLIQKLAELPENSEVIIQMKSKKGNEGYISYFEVSKAEEEIPIIEESNYGTEQDIPEESF